MNAIDHRNARKRIAKTFLALNRVCDQHKDFPKYLALIRQEEKGHRRFCPDGVQCGLTISEAVKLFSVSSIFERFVSQHEGESIFTPEAKDYFAVRQSIFAACAIAHDCADEILREFAKPEMVNFLARCDYAELNKDPRQLEAA